MKIGSLFAGMGGLDMAVEQVFPDASPAWFCEWDDAPSKILAHHWPDVPNHRDVTAVDWTQVEPVDILAGGFPCQDVSHAGRRQGLIRDGEGRTRSGLWGEMLKAIDTLRPPLVVAENVRGLLSAKADSDVEPCPWCVGDDGAGSMRALGAVLADLADIGFDAAWAGLRAADVGAAHGRFRVFILAWPTADTHRDVFGQLAGAPSEQEARADEGDRSADSRGGRRADLTLLPTPAARDWKGHRVQVAGRRPDSKDSINRAIAHLLPTPVADNSRGLVSDSTEFQSLPNEVAYRWGEYADAIARWETVIGRAAPDPTEPGPKDNPRLSPRFVEWLMGLPTGHVTDPAIGLTRNQQLKALGNGVVPAQGAAALRHLLNVRYSDLSTSWRVAA